MDRAMPKRSVLAFMAVVTQLCLGAVYSWSVFRKPLEVHYGWSAQESSLPFQFVLLFYALGMLLGGIWQDRVGPRAVAITGGVLLGTGCTLAGLFGREPIDFILFYGLLGGLGIGFAYVAPLAVCLKWFPEMKGRMVGFAVLGFGAGSALFAPIFSSWLGHSPESYAETIPQTFFRMAFLFTIVVIVCGSFFCFPPSNWKPKAFEMLPPKSEHQREFFPGDIVRTGQFYLLWLIFFCGVASGFAVISEVVPFLTALGSQRTGAIPVVSAAAISYIALSNGAGRLVWGTLSDRLGREYTLAIIFGAMLLVSLALTQTTSITLAIVLVSCIGFSFGGILATMPALTSETFGTRYIGTNYGLLFTAFGFGGVLVPGLASAIVGDVRNPVNYQPVFLMTGIVSSVGLLLSLLLSRTRTSRTGRSQEASTRSEKSLS
ncbi:MAG: OFA family MFS transporter [Fimbriimonadaceae bacterium]|jgi:OFA family oxalate/formate antiporter-like MFS transporter|nr:OFA family MFS transporter [Fimbriimonadaceae bacterium]